jgi:hypothetical protein
MPKTIFGLLSALIVLFVSATAVAQGDKAEGTTRMVLLNVPGGGTERVAETLLSIGNMELRDQDWFIKEIRKRGMTPKRIMSRPKDLVWIMQGGDIDFILYFQGEGEEFQGTVVGEEGMKVDEFKLDRTSDGISEAGLRIIKLEIEELLGVAASQIDIDEEIAKREAAKKEAAEAPDDPADARRKAIEERRALEERLSKDWIWARANARMFKRDLVYAGADGAILTYKSGFYPGFSFNVEAYPTALFNPEGAGVGLMLDYAMGFDSLTFEAAGDGGTEAVTQSIGHMEIEGGLIYRLDSPIGSDGGTNTVRVRVKLTGRHERYTLEDERALPSLSRTTVVAGATVSHPVLIPELAVQGFFEFLPFGFNQTGAELFGDTSGYTYGFATGVGGLFELTEAFAVIFGYRFRVTRPSYVGDGELDFNDTTGFELVQGLHLGILYQY